MENICKLYFFISHYLRYRLTITNNDNSHTQRISTSMFTFMTKGRQLSNKINLKMYMYLNLMRLIILYELFVVIIWFSYLFRKGELQQNSNKSSFISVSFCCVNLPSKTKLLQIRPHNAFNCPTRTVNIQCFCATHTVIKLTARDILVKFSTYIGKLTKSMVRFFFCDTYPTFHVLISVLMIAYCT